MGYAHLIQGQTKEVKMFGVFVPFLMTLNSNYKNIKVEFEWAKTYYTNFDPKT